MIVYVLMGAVQYEGSSLLGVYATIEGAERAKAAREKDSDSIFDFDEYYIVEETIQQ